MRVRALRTVLVPAGLALIAGCGYSTGMHLAPEFGHTVEVIEADGFPIAERVAMLESSDGPDGTAKAIGAGVTGFAHVFAREVPDILLVIGDRFEMLTAVLAVLMPVMKKMVLSATADLLLIPSTFVKLP